MILAPVLLLQIGGCLEAASLVTSDVPHEKEPGDTLSGEAFVSDEDTRIEGPPPADAPPGLPDTETPGETADVPAAATTDPGSSGTDACSLNPPPCYCFVEEACTKLDTPRCLDDSTAQACVVYREDPLCLGWAEPSTCNDGLECTDDSCDHRVGVCEQILRPGWCLKHGQCVECE